MPKRIDKETVEAIRQAVANGEPQGEIAKRLHGVTQRSLPYRERVTTCREQ